MNPAWLLYGYQAILFWVGLPIAIFLLLWWIDRKRRKRISLDIWGFCQPKTAPTRLGEVSYHWAVGEQQGGYRNRLSEVFQPFTSCCLLQKDRLDLGRFKKYLAISPIPLPSVKGPCRYAFNASFTRTVDTPLPAIFAA